uniref:Glycosyltransferase n=1 Tax=Marseillevirus LCMAC201 TaxID=2506605 RepID=A0A481YVT8_9VIRU|nr:MAG: glycosyltransferase [Marseillevirus LCMAC201]
MRVVGSLSTIPSRITGIEKTLVSLSNQSYKLDAVYLNVPYTSQREDTEYQIPSVLTNYCHIVRGQDYGPITKIIGALLQEDDPETIIITFDDDKVYPEGLVDKLLSKHRSNPETAIGSAGFKIGTFPFYMSTVHNEHEHNKKWYTFDVASDGEAVDVLRGAPGVLYVRKFFPDLDHLDKLLRHSIENSVMFRNDDIVISGLLSQRGIERRVYKMPHVEESGNDSNGLSDSCSEYFFSLIKALYHARKEGMFKNQVDYCRSKTMTCPIIMVLVVIVLFSVFSICKCRTNLLSKIPLT